MFPFFSCLSLLPLFICIFNYYKQIRLVFGGTKIFGIFYASLGFLLCWFALRTGEWKGIHNTHSRKEKKIFKKEELVGYSRKLNSGLTSAREIIVVFFVLFSFNGLRTWYRIHFSFLKCYSNYWFFSLLLLPLRVARKIGRVTTARFWKFEHFVSLYRLLVAAVLVGLIWSI